MDVESDLGSAIFEARAAFDAGDAARACDLLEPHKVDGWNDAAFVRLLGAACCVAGYRNEGIAALQRAVELAPAASALYNLGRAHEIGGDASSARQCYQRALNLDPAYTQASESLAALAQRGQTAASGAVGISEPAPPQPEPAAQPEPPAPPVLPPAAVGYTGDGAEEPRRPSGPRTPEQIAIAEWEKEDELRQRRREYILAGVKYGAAIGAILMCVQHLAFSLLGDFALMMQGGGEGGGFGSLMLGLVTSGLAGAAYGSVIGLFVAWRVGGALEGGIAGAVVLLLGIQVLGRINGMGNAELYVASFANALMGALSGALIGYLTQMSITD